MSPLRPGVIKQHKDSDSRSQMIGVPCTFKMIHRNVYIIIGSDNCGKKIKINKKIPYFQSIGICVQNTMCSAAENEIWTKI